MPKFVWRNLKEDDEKLGYEDIPHHAIQLEKSSLHKNVQIIYFLVIVGISFVSLYLTRSINGHIQIGRPFIILGIILGILSGLPHEILHGIVMPSDSIVYIGMNQNRIGMYEYCAKATSKGVFVLSSLLPTLLGIIPFVAFLCIDPRNLILSGILWGFSTVALISVCQDVADIVFMLVHVPKNNYIQPANGFYVYFKK